ncbi:hypothetical protein [Streptomyces bacillaris]|uniref:hypothetical protein n=1 Tax=Streptomyces bacillaris TaxID=68179 RepID=UPI003465D7E5
MRPAYVCTVHHDARFEVPLLQANARIGLGLLATVVNLTGMTPEETIRKARQLAAENTG